MIETLFLLKIIFLVKNWTENVKTAITNNYRQYCKVQTKLKYNQVLKKMYILMSNLSNYSKQFCVKMEFDGRSFKNVYRIEVQ